MKRIQIIIASGVIVISIIFLIISSTQSTAQYYLTPEDYYKNPTLYDNKEIRISGVVVEGSVIKNSAEASVTFKIKGRENYNPEAMSSNKEITIIYNKGMPDLLNENIDVIAYGRIKYRGVVEASELLFKCPSKYESKGL